jgi:uncharacterized protein with HEPN domain
MPRSVQARLDDMLGEISAIRDATQGVSFDAFAAAWHLRRAVERALEIISEASRSLPDDLKALSPDLPWRQIADLGNLLRHEYQRVEPRIIWTIVQDRLGPLETALRDLTQRLV